MSGTSTAGGGSRRTISLERIYGATVDELWELWTTERGIESWWGPDGFKVTVIRLDLRVGGELRYTMRATDPDQIEFMAQAGMPIATEVSLVYTDIEPSRRLGYTSVADFIPGTPPYDMATTVTFDPTAAGVRMVLTFDAMHDEQWTERAVAGHEGQLGKLDTVLHGGAYGGATAP
jgi:uncharacterized protein YndB with AHSA1/START domain